MYAAELYVLAISFCQGACHYSSAHAQCANVIYAVELSISAFFLPMLVRVTAAQHMPSVPQRAAGGPGAAAPAATRAPAAASAGGAAPACWLAEPLRRSESFPKHV